MTVFTAYDMVFMWPQTHLEASTTAFYSQRIGLRQNKKSESETPCSASDKTFLKTTGQAIGSVLCLCTRGGESGRECPGRARHPDERAPRAGAVTEATWKLPLHDGAGGCPVKAGWSTLKTEHRQKFI